MLAMPYPRIVIIALFALLLSPVVAQQQQQTATSPATTEAKPEAKPSKSDPLQRPEFDTVAADALMGLIGEGIAGHNRKLLLSAFDKERYPHFNEMKMLVDGWMRRNRSFM